MKRTLGLLIGFIAVVGLIGPASATPAQQDTSSTTAPYSGSTSTSLGEDGKTRSITFTFTFEGEEVTATLTVAPGDNQLTFSINNLTPGAKYTVQLFLERALASAGGAVGSGARIVTAIALPAQAVKSVSATANASGSASFGLTMAGLAPGTYLAQIGNTAGATADIGRFTVTAGDIAAATAAAAAGKGSNFGSTATSTGGSAGGSTGGSTGGGSALPNTGSDSTIPLAGFGVILVALGGVLVYAVRKRRSTAFAS